MMLRAAPTEVKGRYTRGSLLPHAPEAKLPRLHQRFVAKMLRNKTFAPEFCSLISNWFGLI